MSEDPEVTACPCGSGASYGDCCEPLHRGRRSAATAEALMRSRYSAFAAGEREYLLSTWHPRTRPTELELDPDLEWRRLQIRETTAGTEDDSEGGVHFVAHFYDRGRREYGRLEEHSRFVREAGRWLYLDAAG